MDANSVQVKIYPYRWVILLIFCIYSSINFLQFLQYSIIANIVTKYYKVDSFMVDLTGLVFMIGYILFSLPVNYLINRYNLRIIAILSSSLTTIGNLIKLLSVDRDRFYLVIIGQSLCAIGQVFMLTIPSKLASTWFGPDQVSSACAIAILGTQFGIAIGCIIPSYLVRNTNNIDNIGHDLLQMLIYNAVVTCVATLLVVLFFRAKPELPPSQSQIYLSTHENSVMDALIKICKNKNSVLLLTTFGMGNGIWTSFGLLINTIYLEYFPDSEEDLGIITCIAILIGGCFGSVLFGYILDKTHKFRSVSVSLFFGSAILLILAVYTLIEQIKLATYFTIPLFSLFLASSLVVGFEFATEVTYPLPEAIPCGILNAFIYLFGIIFTLAFEALFDAIGYEWTTTIIVCLLFLCSILCFFIKPTLYRYEANLLLN